MAHLTQDREDPGPHGVQVIDIVAEHLGDPGTVFLGSAGVTQTDSQKPILQQKAGAVLTRRSGPFANPQSGSNSNFELLRRAGSRAEDGAEAAAAASAAELAEALADAAASAAEEAEAAAESAAAGAASCLAQAAARARQRER